MNLENSQQNNDINTKSPHAGNAPEDMRERPHGKHYDNTTLPEAVNQGLIETEHDTLPEGWIKSQPETIEKDKKIGRKVIAGAVGLFLAAGVSVVGLKSMNNTDDERDVAPVGPIATAPATAASGETATPTAEATKTPEIIAPAGKFSPEALAELTPTQLTERFTIKADTIKTPEQYLAAFIERLNAQLNAGHTVTDYGSYAAAGKGVFEAAMVEKYADPIAIGMFNKTGTGYDTISYFANKYNLMSIAGRGGEYRATTAEVKDSTKFTVRPNGFDIKVTITTRDNLRIKDIAGDTDGTNPTKDESILTINNVQADDKGNLYPSYFKETKTVTTPQHIENPSDAPAIVPAK